MSVQQTADKLYQIKDLIYQKDSNGNRTFGRLGSVSRPQFYKLRASGEFPDPVIIAGVKYWTEEQVQEWFASLTAKVA